MRLPAVLSLLRRPDRDPAPEPSLDYRDSVPFTVERSVERGVCVFAVRGDLDIITSYTLASAVEDAPPRTVLDLTACRFLDSTGLSVLSQLALRLRGGLAIARRPDSPPARVLDLAGIDALTVRDSREQAVRAVR